MARPSGTKNIMRTPEEKEEIIREYLEGRIGRNEICRKYNIATSTLRDWRILYEKEGLKRLKSQTGKHNNPNTGKYNRNPSRTEKLELELLKKEIEILRLKKGYQVKGVGAKKEYVTTFDVNTK